MISPRAARVPVRKLLLVLCALVLGVAGTQATRGTAPHPEHARMLAAAHTMQRVQQVLHDIIVSEQIEILPEDINQTGLIGPQWTALTSSMGVLEAKRTSLNPNFAALMVRLYSEAGLKSGDTVAMGLSGSFPGLCIAALAAANQMGLTARVIASYGSSMYGGSRPEMTTIRMLTLLKEQGILQFDMVAVSPGGEGDQGINPYWEDARQVVLSLARQDGYALIDESDLARNIAIRMEHYGDGIDAFVNVGGALANVGREGISLMVNPGLTCSMDNLPQDNTRGVMLEFLARGVPVIHLLNVRALAADFGLPYDPVPLPQPGEGEVYVVHTVSPWPALAALLVCAYILVDIKKAGRTSRTRP